MSYLYLAFDQKMAKIQKEKFFCFHYTVSDPALDPTCNTEFRASHSSLPNPYYIHIIEKVVTQLLKVSRVFFIPILSHHSNQNYIYFLS
jgi:hypothetical protein